MSKHPYTINVSGSIVSYGGNHYAQGYAAGGIASLDGTYADIKDYSFEQANHGVRGDLILNGTKRIPPYATMCDEGGIAELDLSDTFGLRMDGGITYLPGYDAAIRYYYDNMTQIKALLYAKIDNSLEPAFLRGLYVDAFSVIELFLGDFLLCGIFTEDKCYDRLLTSKIFNIPEGSSSLEIEKIIFDTIEKTVFHRFKDIKVVYKEILDIDFPETIELEQLLYRRHNIVHRFSYSNLDRIRLCIPKREDVDKLIKECDSFVSQLMSRI